MHVHFRNNFFKLQIEFKGAIKKCNANCYPFQKNKIKVILITCYWFIFVQPGQINMAVFFWYLVKSDILRTEYQKHMAIKGGGSIFGFVENRQKKLTI